MFLDNFMKDGFRSEMEIQVKKNSFNLFQVFCLKRYNVKIKYINWKILLESTSEFPWHFSWIFELFKFVTMALIHRLRKDEWLAHCALLRTAANKEKLSRPVVVLLSLCSVICWSMWLESVLQCGDSSPQFIPFSPLFRFVPPSWFSHSNSPWSWTLNVRKILQSLISLTVAVWGN